MNDGKKYIIVIFVLSILLFVLFSSLIFVIFLVALDSKNVSIPKNEKYGTLYHLTEVNPINNYQSNGLVKLNHKLTNDEYISYLNEVTGNYAIISRLGRSQYECVGSCSCSNNNNNISPRRTTNVLTKGLHLLLSAVSAGIAYKIANEAFRSSCIEQYANECDESEIISEVEDCHYVQMDGETLSDEKIREMEWPDDDDEEEDEKSKKVNPSAPPIEEVEEAKEEEKPKKTKKKVTKKRKKKVNKVYVEEKKKKKNRIYKDYTCRGHCVEHPGITSEQALKEISDITNGGCEDFELDDVKMEMDVTDRYHKYKDLVDLDRWVELQFVIKHLNPYCKEAGEYTYEYLGGRYNEDFPMKYVCIAGPVHKFDSSNVLCIPDVPHPQPLTIDEVIPKEKEPEQLSLW